MVIPDWLDVTLRLAEIGIIPVAAAIPVYLTRRATRPSDIAPHERRKGSLFNRMLESPWIGPPILVLWGAINIGRLVHTTKVATPHFVVHIAWELFGIIYGMMYFFLMRVMVALRTITETMFDFRAESLETSATVARLSKINDGAGPAKPDQGTEAP